MGGFLADCATDSDTQHTDTDISIYKDLYRRYTCLKVQRYSSAG